LKKQKKQKDVEDTKRLLEESIEEYLNNNKIIGILKLSKENTRTITSVENIMEMIRKKTINKLGRKITKIIKEDQQEA